MNSAITVAVAQYDISFHDSWTDFSDKLTRWIEQATRNNAVLLAFPEYGSMELTSLFAPEVYGDLQQQLHAMQDLYPDWCNLHEQLARQFNVMISSASFPVLQKDGSFRNRAALYGPEGLLGYQDKLVMTRFEKEQWFISASDQISVIDTDIGRIGISICYDIEFPLLARQQVEAGADLIIVPSCTDTEAGFHRVRIGCQARALENQCYVLQSPTVGKAEWSPAVDINTGRASIYTPVDHSFPANGILAEGSHDTPGWVYAELDLTRIDAIRKDGQVTNYNDWHEQKLKILQ